MKLMKCIAACLVVTPIAVFAASDHCVIGDCENGSGVMDYADGHYYSGGFRNGHPHGDGAMIISPIGNRVELDCNKKIKTSVQTASGTWKNGFLEGKGAVVFADKSVYVGDFVGWKFDGIGMLKCSDRSIYAGDFKKGLRDGSGRLFNPNSGKIGFQDVIFDEGRLVSK